MICKYWLKKYDRLPDAIVIEGPKAGGHLGFSLEDLEKYKGNNDYDKEIAEIIECVNNYANEKNVKIPIAAE